MIDRFSAILRRFGPIVGVTAASQFIAALAILLIPVALAPGTADTFALGMQAGNAGFTGVVIGVIYNLAIGRPGYARWTGSALLAALVSPALALLTLLCVRVFDPVGEAIASSDVLVLLIFGLGGSGMAFGGTFAVKKACEGEPRLLAITTIAPNLMLLAGLSVTVILAPASPLVLAAMWATAAWTQAIVIAIVVMRPKAPAAVSDTDSPHLARHAVGLGIGVICSTVLPTVYLSALTQLEPGTTAIVFVVARIGTAVVALEVNSFLLRAYSWGSAPRRPTVLLRWGVGLALGAGLLSMVISFAWSGTVAYVPLAAMWLLLLICAAIALREMNSRALASGLLLKSVIDLAVSVPLAIYYAAFPSISGFFGVYCVSQALTLAVMALLAKERILAVLSLLMLLPSLWAVIFGW